MPKSKWFPDPTEPVAHMQRNPGETFKSMAKRTGVDVPVSEVELRRPRPDKWLGKETK